MYPSKLNYNGEKYYICFNGKKHECKWFSPTVSDIYHWAIRFKLDEELPKELKKATMIITINAEDEAYIIDIFDIRKLTSDWFYKIHYLSTGPDHRLMKLKRLME